MLYLTVDLYGAGYEGLAVCNIMEREDSLEDEIIEIIFNAYYEVMSNLYRTAVAEDKVESLINETLDRQKVYNIRERSFDGNQVYTSIETDIAILEAISRIITIMYTANQALLVDPMQNAYINLDKD